MKDSKYQAAIKSALITTANNVAVSAAPGSGKTTTLVECAKVLPYGKKAIFVAFNRHIVQELKNRLPQSITASTMHSLGAKAIGAHYEGGWFLEEKKQVKYLMPLFDHEKDNKKKWGAIYQLDRVMQLARATMTKPDKEGIDKLIENYALDCEEEYIPILIRAMKRMEEDNNDDSKSRIGIDYQDMIAMPALNKDIAVPQFDYVMVDECNDMSALDIMFLRRLVKPMRGRMISVGDKNQSIYGFRGSSPDSFEQFANYQNTISLPLSISYRCAKKIVEEANKIYPVIEAWEDSPEGIVRIGTVDEIAEGDSCLCRNTRPLFDVFFQLIEANKKAYIVGKELEKGLLALLPDHDTETKCNTLIINLDGPLKAKYEALRSKGIAKPEVHPKYILLQEKTEIMRLLFSRFTYVFEVEDFIQNVFEDEERDGVKLMTIHKSKGLESNRVFIIEKYKGADLIPSQYAITKDQLTQERNLQFVSITRAKKELVYLHL